MRSTVVRPSTAKDRLVIDSMVAKNNPATVPQKSQRKRTYRSGQAESGNGAHSAASDGNDFRPGLISAFILFHLIAIICWGLPWQARPVQTVNAILRPYMLWTGLFQSWNMFAPDPTPLNSYVKAVVITRDRHLKVWNFPRMEELNLSQRYRQERYRKFQEVLPDIANQALWPDVATHVARMFASEADPPDRVMLIRFSSPIDPARGESEESPAQPWDFYDDYIDPGDLK